MTSTPENQPRSIEHRDNSLDELAHEQSERLRHHYEKVGEHSPEHQNDSSEQARHEALATARSAEKDARLEKDSVISPAVRRGSIKHERDMSYQRTMAHIQSELSVPSRAFSKVIHHKAVEATSEVAGATIARPNAILAGAVAAFIFSLGTYLLAKHFGYHLSGFETIGAFIVGWVVGLLIDYFRVMITGKRS